MSGKGTEEILLRKFKDKFLLMFKATEEGAVKYRKTYLTLKKERKGGKKATEEDL